MWVRKCANFAEDRQADREFWAQLTPAERISALEDLRAQWIATIDMVTKDFEELFACLNARNVRAVIVGGYAFAFHAKPRVTKDIKVFVDPTPENAERLIRGWRTSDSAVSASRSQILHPPARLCSSARRRTAGPADHH